MAKGLGKGLSALMSDDYSQTVKHATPDSPANPSNTLPIGDIISGKFQPRTRFTEEYLQELAQSIRKNGIMQPIVVRAAGARYEIIAGERRWRAAKLAGLTEVPAIIRDISDQQALELALVENIQRQDLTPLEEAAGYQRLIDEFTYTQEELAATVGKSRSHVANLLRLLSLPDKIKQYLDADKITMGHARALLGCANAEALAEEVVQRGLNVRQTESLAKAREQSERKSRSSGNGSGKTGPRDKDPEIMALEENLSENLGMRVSILDQGQRGEITIAYESLNQLDRILQRLGGSA